MKSFYNFCFFGLLIISFCCVTQISAYAEEKNIDVATGKWQWVGSGPCPEKFTLQYKDSNGNIQAKDITPSELQKYNVTDEIRNAENTTISFTLRDESGDAKYTVNSNDMNTGKLSVTDLDSLVAGKDGLSKETENDALQAAAIRTDAEKGNNQLVSPINIVEQADQDKCLVEEKTDAEIVQESIDKTKEMGNSGTNSANNFQYSDDDGNAAWNKGYNEAAGSVKDPIKTRCMPDWMYQQAVKDAADFRKLVGAIGGEVSLAKDIASKMNSGAPSGVLSTAIGGLLRTLGPDMAENMKNINKDFGKAFENKNVQSAYYKGISGQPCFDKSEIASIKVANPEAFDSVKNHMDDFKGAYEDFKNGNIGAAINDLLNAGISAEVGLAAFQEKSDEEKAAAEAAAGDNTSEGSGSGGGGDTPIIDA